MKRRHPFIALVFLAAAGPWNATQAAQPCYAKESVTHAVTQPGAKDTFVVEIIGKSCADARVLISLEVKDGDVFPLAIRNLSDFSERTPIDQAAAAAAVKEAASRIDSAMQTPLESWADLERAGTQPDGAPWRGTPLTRGEYERLLKLKPRYVIVPTDFTRNKLVVWDPHGMGRPVDFVYFGD